MKVLITGTSQGIGKAAAEKFLKEGHDVIGVDVQHSTITNDRYTHYQGDVKYLDQLSNQELCDPEDYIDPTSIDILVNNAGVQGTFENDINVNLKALIAITETFGVQPNIKSIVNIGSASAHTGAEFPHYCASKGGVIAYTKNVAQRIAKYGATCNSLDFGGVLTELNKPVIEDKKLWNQIMDLTPLKRWATPEEAADWIYFISVVNKFCTGQNILIDGFEAGDFKFVWKDL